MPVDGKPFASQRLPNSLQFWKPHVGELDSHYAIPKGALQRLPLKDENEIFATFGVFCGIVGRVDRRKHTRERDPCEGTSVEFSSSPSPSQQRLIEPAAESIRIWNWTPAFNGQRELRKPGALRRKGVVWQ